MNIDLYLLLLRVKNYLKQQRKLAPLLLVAWSLSKKFRYNTYLYTYLYCLLSTSILTFWYDINLCLQLVQIFRGTFYVRPLVKMFVNATDKRTTDETLTNILNLKNNAQGATTARRNGPVSVAVGSTLKALKISILWRHWQHMNRLYNYISSKRCKSLLPWCFLWSCHVITDTLSSFMF